MIRHIVLWTFHKQADGRSQIENLQIAKRMLLDMKGQIPGIISIDCGINFNGSEAAWDLALFTEFETMEDLDVYQDHPAHLKVKEFMAKVRDKRAVADWNIEIAK